MSVTRTFTRITFGIGAAMLAFAISAASTSASHFDDGPTSPTDTVRSLDNYANLPLAFGAWQLDSLVGSDVLGSRSTFYLPPDELLEQLMNLHPATVQASPLPFDASERRPRLAGDERAPGIVNYFEGENPVDWRTGGR
jgi:hypothetical protein